MGHRREVFRPRSRKVVRNQILTAIQNQEYEKAIKIASFSYSRASVADDFSISFIAAAEAVKIGRELSWSRSSDVLASIGLAVAETKLEVSVYRSRRPIILESLSRAIELARKEESS